MASNTDIRPTPSIGIGSLINVENINLEKLAGTSILLLAPIIVAGATRDILLALEVTVIVGLLYGVLRFRYQKPPTSKEKIYPQVRASTIRWLDRIDNNIPEPYHYEITFDDVKEMNDYMAHLQKDGFVLVVASPEKYGSTYGLGPAPLEIRGLIIKKDMMNKIYTRYQRWIKEETKTLTPLQKT
jgi:hypothetical protein